MTVVRFLTSKMLMVDRYSRRMNCQESGSENQNRSGVAELLQWSNAALADISECVNNAYLGSKNKNNLRQLTKAEFKLWKLKSTGICNTTLSMK